MLQIENVFNAEESRNLASAPQGPALRNKTFQSETLLNDSILFQQRPVQVHVLSVVTPSVAKIQETTLISVSGNTMSDTPLLRSLPQ